MLKHGDDYLRLNLFTELEYRVKKKSVCIRAFFIYKMSCAGFSLLLDTVIKEMVHCFCILPSEDSDEFELSDDLVKHPEIRNKPVRTSNN